MQNRELGADDLGKLLLFAAVIFGAWFRLFPPHAAGFPINDGGLFFRMIEAIQSNGYRLPESVLYNGLAIPFAYPPLALYVAGVVTTIFQTTLFNTLLWFPAAILICVIPAFYYLATLLLKSRFQAGLAALLYAVLPRSIAWMIMGGGVTRSLGHLFLILASANIYLLYTTKQKKYLAWSTVFCSLVCLTHPEAAIHTMGIAFLLWFFYGKSKDGIIASLIIATGTLIVTSPWWITILRRFGPAPYLSATQTGLNSLGYTFRVFQPFSGEPFVAIIFILAILGIAIKIAKREYLLPIWFAFPFILEPRNAPNVSILPMAMLASIALTELLLPALSKIESAARNLQYQHVLQSRIEKYLLVCLLLYSLIGMQHFDMGLKENSLSPTTREVFEWINSNIPADARFLIVTGKTDLFADAVNEWFPVLTGRRSLTTIQGYEWIGNGEFAKRAPSMQGIQNCPNSSGALLCIEKKIREAGLDYDYLYVTRSGSGITWGDNLVFDVEEDEEFATVLKTDSVAIFEKK